MDKVSIIIPVYNVELYVGECVDSLLKQTHKELEIILVDDGSTDSSPDICDSYAEKDSRIRVIHKQNGGAASARNEGLRVFTGDYVCLVDSDDTVRQDYISNLLAAVHRHNADAAVCSYKNIYRNTSTGNPIEFPKDECMSASEYLKRFLTDWTCGIAWNKIFKAEAVRDVRYSEGHKIDDEFFTYKAVMNCQRVAISDEPLYLYRMRAASVMNNASKYKGQIIRDHLGFVTERYSDVSKRFPELKIPYLENLADWLITLKRNAAEHPNELKIVKKSFLKYFIPVIFSRCKTGRKLDFIIAMLSPAQKNGEAAEFTRDTEGFEFFE